MTPLTKEWIIKGDRDYSTMLRELRVTEDPNYDAVCFHAQQCIEKLLKGFLQEEVIYFPKIHDLEELLQYTLEVRPEWSALKDDCSVLTNFATSPRYPGENPTLEEATEAVNACKRVRTILRQAFRDIDQLRF